VPAPSGRPSRSTFEGDGCQWLKLTEGIDPGGGYPGPGLVADAIAAVPLYRSNISRKVAAPDPRRARVPVHQIVATKDFYVSPSVLACSEQYVDEFTRSEVAAGHWSPRTHPERVADLIADAVAAHHNTPARQPTPTVTDRIPEESIT
jgi:pimeloyl-ACP methyl ester carboxylesterase